MCMKCIFMNQHFHLHGSQTQAFYLNRVGSHLPMLLFISEFWIRSSTQSSDQDVRRATLHQPDTANRVKMSRAQSFNNVHIIMKQYLLS